MPESLDNGLSDASKIGSLSEQHERTIEEFRARHATELLVILFTDIVGSTGLKERLGDQRAVEIVALHRRLIDEALAKTPNAQIIDRVGDANLIVFVKPGDAVAFALRALRLHRAARAKEVPDLPEYRTGIHMGTVVVEHQDGTAAGPGAINAIRGLQVDTAARIVAMAEGGQVLCSRIVGDDARQALKGADLEGSSPLRWVSHGPYLLAGRDEPLSICEVGEEGVAPFRKPGAGEKSKPVEVAQEVEGWRPGLDSVLPGTNWVMERKLGEGGFGEVWLARDRALTARKTVFKFCLLKNKVPSLRREFDVFNHLVTAAGRTPPGIAQVLGAHDDAPPYYIQLEFVTGGDLHAWIESRGKDTAIHILLDLAGQMARALDRIHRAGYVHRDVKPSNFLVEPDEDPARAPTLKISDFGIGQEALRDAQGGQPDGAAAGQGGGFTVHTGTLAAAAGSYFFIAPELLRSSSTTPGNVAKRASTAADIYSLGVTLYQLFSGDVAASPDPGLRAVADPILREDIERCLNHAPDVRPTAAELVQAFDGYDARRAAHETAERAILRRQRRRAFRAVATLVVLLSLALLSGGFAMLQYRRAEGARRSAEAERSQTEEARKDEAAARLRAETEQYIANMNLSQQLANQGNYTDAIQTLWNTPESQRSWEWGAWLRLTENYLVSMEGSGSPIAGADLSHDGRLLVTGSEDGTAIIWDLESMRTRHELRGHGSPVLYCAFSPDGRQVATGTTDGRVRLWDTESGALVHDLVRDGVVRKLTDIAFSPDGSRVAASSWEIGTRVWDCANGKETLRIRQPGAVGIAFVAGGKQILRETSLGQIALHDAITGEIRWASANSGASFSRAKTVCVRPGENRAVRVSGPPAIISVETGESLISLPTGKGTGEKFFDARYSPDGRWIGLAWADRTAQVFDAADGHLVSQLIGHTHSIMSIAFSPDGSRVVTACHDGTARLWDTESGRPLRVFTGHSDALYCAWFSPDGLRVYTASKDGTVKVWAADGAERFQRLANAAPLTVALWSPDGRRVVTGGHDGTSTIWDAETGARLHDLQGHTDMVLAADFSPDGKKVVTASADKTIRLWDVVSGREDRLFAGHEGAVAEVRFLAGGARLASASWAPVVSWFDSEGLSQERRLEPDKTIRLWDVETGDIRLKVDTAEEGACLPASGDARLFAFCHRYFEEVWIVEASSGDIVQQLRSESPRLFCGSPSFSPDARTLATLEPKTLSIRIWDVSSGNLEQDLPGEVGSPGTLENSPDGDLFLIGAYPASIWDRRTGRKVSVLQGVLAFLRQPRLFAWEGRVVGPSLFSARVWHVETGKCLLEIGVGDKQGIFLAAPSPDMKRLLGATDQGEVRIYDADPWRLEDLPGDATMTWRQRYDLWKREQYLLGICSSTASQRLAPR